MTVPSPQAPAEAYVLSAENGSVTIAIHAPTVEHSLRRMHPLASPSAAHQLSAHVCVSSWSSACMAATALCLRRSPRKAAVASVQA